MVVRVLVKDSNSRKDKGDKKGLMEHRKSQLNNIDISWTGYKDCPFVNQKKVQEYKSLTAGWYYAMYQLMVSISGNAITKGYPITAKEVEFLILEVVSSII